MTTENIIVWQKWADPFGTEEEDDAESDLLNEEEPSEPFHDDEEILEETEEDVDKEINLLYSMSKRTRSQIKVMATPMGIIPINENTASGKIFNFWVGHTNFNITKQIASIIESAEGVETLDIFTRYRFRISVGKAFSDSETMRDINKIIYQILDNVK